MTKKICRKGIILAGGTGSRLWPITISVSKQLIPIHDKPMIYYPLSLLMLCGIREIAIITTPQDRDQFKRLLGDGSQWGVEFEYIVQQSPRGIAEAYLLAESYLNGAPSALVLGDNIFFGHGLIGKLEAANASSDGATVFGYRVSEPSKYGVLEFTEDAMVVGIEEKPEKPKSDYAITGLYFLDSSASERARHVKPSIRGELEIVSVLETYLYENLLSTEKLGRGVAWLDTGTHFSLSDATNFVRTLQVRQGVLVGSPDEIAFRQRWISISKFQERVSLFAKSEYGKSLRNLLDKQ